jgi:flagellar biosynthetic protein FliS
MEAGQLHLGRAIQALSQNDTAVAARSFIRVSEVIHEAGIRLDLEGGGLAAQNLRKLYDHWSQEIMAASHVRDTIRLEAVGRGMGEIRQAWEQLQEQKAKTGRVSTFQLGNQVV